MRIMAIDYGDARTGVAVSDPMGLLAGEAWVIAERDVEVLADTIKNDAEKRSVSLFIVGLPKNMDGSVGERARKSEAFAERLRELSGIEVKLWDERLTTVDAHRILTRVGRRRQKKTVDAVAATLILEGYLNSVG